MIFEEMLREEKQEGRQEGRLEATRENILELLEDLGEIPEDLQTKLEDLEDLTKLRALHKIAVKAESLRAFEKKAEIYFNTKDKKLKKPKSISPKYYIKIHKLIKTACYFRRKLLK